MTVAYVEGGINWHLGDASTLAGDVYVNWHEAPVPCTGTSVATATMVVGGVTQACTTHLLQTTSRTTTSTPAG